jgi:hypothetical protein
MLRRPILALSAAFIAGWLMCLGAVEWRQHARTAAPGPAKPASALSAAASSPLPAAPEPEPSPGLEAIAAAGKLKATAPSAAPTEADSLETAPSVPGQSQGEHDALAQLFKKNRDNLHLLSGH